MPLGILILNIACALASIWISSKLLVIFSLALCMAGAAFLKRNNLLALIPYFLWLLSVSIFAPLAIPALAVAIQIRIFLAKKVDHQAKELKERAKSLRSLLPEESLVFVDMDIEAKTPLAQIQEGHLVRLNTGDVAPCDGTITFGSGIVDESSLTGETEPKIKSLGNQILAGSKVTNGSIIFRSSSRFDQSFLSQFAKGLESPLKASAWLFFFDAVPVLSAAYLFWAEADWIQSSIPLLFTFGFYFQCCQRIRRAQFRTLAGDLGISCQDLDTIASSEMILGSSRPLLKESKCKWIDSAGEWSEDTVLRMTGPLARKLEDEASYALMGELHRRKIPLALLDSFECKGENVLGIIEGQEVEWIPYFEAVDRNLDLTIHESYLKEHLNRGNVVRVLLHEKKVKNVMAFEQKVRSLVTEGKNLLDQLGIPFVLVSPKLEVELSDLSNFPIRHRAKTPVSVLEILQKMKTNRLNPVWLESKEYHLNTPSFTGPYSASPSSLAHFAHLQLITVARLLALALHFRKKESVFFLQHLLFQGLSLVYFIHQPIQFAALASILFLGIGYFQSKWIADPFSV